MSEEKVSEYTVGQVVKKGRSKYIIVKVNKVSVTIRHFWDRAVPLTNRRSMTFGDFYTMDIKDVVLKNPLPKEKSFSTP